MEIAGQKIDTLGDNWHLFVLTQYATELVQVPLVARSIRLVRLPENQDVFNRLMGWAKYAGKL